MTALAPIACACSAISWIGQILGAPQFLLVGRRSAADDVADAGEEIAEDVRAEDGLAGHQAVVVHDPLAVDHAGRGEQHGILAATV